MADDREIRASDAERQATVERLAEHYRAGRLTADELEERSSDAHAAVTRGDLARLEADLPAPAPGTAPAPAAPPPTPARDDDGDDEEDESSVAERLRVYAVVIAFLWIIWAVTGAGYPWPIWPMLGWGLGIALAAAGGRSHRRRLPGPGHPPGLPPLPHERRQARRRDRGR